jgi:hypothetical protein
MLACFANRTDTGRKVFKKLTVLIALALTATATLDVAVAADPVKGAKYSGDVDVTATLTVSFKVSRSGEKVKSLKVRPSLPNSCGYGGPLPTQTSKPAKIEDGKFAAKVTDKSADGTVIETAKVKGRFLADRKERGKIKATLPNAESCNGKFPYSTKAEKKG